MNVLDPVTGVHNWLSDDRKTAVTSSIDAVHLLRNIVARKSHPWVSSNSQQQNTVVVVIIISRLVVYRGNIAYNSALENKLEILKRNRYQILAE